MGDSAINDDSLADDKKKEKKVKSSLHDATPSWNGYNYQGFVGIYVCLKLIKDKLDSISFEQLKESEWAENHSIEYEWLEDFSIKNKNNYLSLHQVKHKDGNNFSDHIEAISTIIDRKRKILNEIDLSKYLKIQGSADSIKKELEKIFTKLNEIGCIDDDRIINDSFDLDEIKEVHFSNYIEMKNILKEIKEFSNNAFDKSKVFFHTTEGISMPSQDLDQYVAIRDIHKEKLRNKRDLKDFSIFFEFDDVTEYELKIDDSIIERKIIELIDQILSKRVCFLKSISGSSSLYFQKIFNLVVNHIRERHILIRSKLNKELSLYSKKIDSICFKKIINILDEQLVEKNLEYWRLYCEYHFSELFRMHIRKLKDGIKYNPDNKELIEKLINNTNKYYNDELYLLANGDIFKLLKKISCNHVFDITEDYTYNTLLNKHGLEEVFFSFIAKIEKKNIGFYYVCDKGKKYQPTSLFISDKYFLFESELEAAQTNILKNLNSGKVDIDDSDYLVVDVPESKISKVDDVKLVSRIIVEELQSDINNYNITSDRNYYFISSFSALERLIK